MAIYKCKMCGGTLEVRPGESVCECEYCGTRQTIPSVMEENLQNLFNRANVLRMKAEFDKAAEIYERIVQADESEAEAYWGLVLCKYGVEYVEDPATFKRIPTCHRTSYEAVTADADYRGAIEHADVSQRRIYEAEAKTIDEIQKGILAVAKKESPYDVFICYKEADENGKRTVDSTIANDIYYQLTQEGFKAFYSAITLEDKLGEEYEPYIFSALNSAKVMLVLGTKPEYFTAVWVKNEWSRFLKLVQNDRSRTLIPCYRDMDAYELPEEFAHLQAQDMAKIGFISDIIRGIKKLIAKPEESAGAEPQQPQVTQTVVQGGNVSKDALVKRGNMALEDGEWDGAKDFFDQALNLDAECGAAYLGKALADGHVSSLVALIKAVGPESVKPQSETLQAGKHDTEAEKRIISENLLPGYLNSIKLESFDFSFSSMKSGWVSARELADKWIKQNKNLNRAVQYGDATLRRQIDDCKKAILSAYDAKITEAERQDEDRKAAISKEYAEFLSHQEKIAIQQKQMAEENREEDYRKAVAAFNQAKIRQEYTDVRQTFTDNKLKDYKESKKYAEECNNIIAKFDGEEKRKRVKRQKRNYIIVIITIWVVVIAIVAVVLSIHVFIPRRNYNQAVAMLDDGQYEDAIEAFTALGSFKDSEDMIQEAQNRRDYETAESYLAAGNYDDAIDVFTQLGDYEDAAERVLATQATEYELAEEYASNGDTQTAAITFGKLGDYLDSQDRAMALWNDFTKDSQSIAGGSYHTVALRSNGSVVATGHNSYGQCDVSGWTDIVSVSAGSAHTIALKLDGTVVTTGSSSSGQCDVSEWADIVAISAGSRHTVGLKSDGTVVAAGDNKDGQCDVSDWADIVAISAGTTHTVGLKSDGTAVATGWNKRGQCDVSGWSNIVSVSAGEDHTVGLKSDGTVVATGDNEYGECDVSEWTDIVTVSAGGDFAGRDFTIGLKSDGTVVAAGQNNCGQCDVSEWTDIVAVSTGSDFTVGLKSDGTVVATGKNTNGQCDVSGWRDILVP